jgi:hypothetical protein
MVAESLHSVALGKKSRPRQSRKYLGASENTSWIKSGYERKRSGKENIIKRWEGKLNSNFEIEDFYHLFNDSIRSAGIALPQPEKGDSPIGVIVHRVAGHATCFPLVFRGFHNPVLAFHSHEKHLALEEIKEQILSLANLKADWDGDNADVIPLPIAEATANFLGNYVDFIFNNLGKQITLPEPAACANGSIDLEWHHHNTRLLINIRYDKDGEIKAFYYGDVNKKDFSIKGNVPVNQVTPHLAIWMKEFLQ